MMHEQVLAAVFIGVFLVPEVVLVWQTTRRLIRHQAQTFFLSIMQVNEELNHDQDHQEKTDVEQGKTMQSENVPGHYRQQHSIRSTKML